MKRTTRLFALFREIAVALGHGPNTAFLSTLTIRGELCGTMAIRPWDVRRPARFR
jgi:hypothetical protein